MPIPAGPSIRYVTPDQVRAVLAPDGESADGDTAAAMDDPAIQVAIAEAADEVDAALSQRYTVPFDAAAMPSLIVSVARDIAAYLASLTFRRGDPLPAGDPVQLRYARAKKILDSLANGSMTLGQSEPSQGAVAVVNPYDENLFAAEDFSLAPAPALSPHGLDWW